MNASIRQFVIHALRPFLHLLHVSGFCSSVLALPGLESLRWRIGELGVWIRFYSARSAVPAYKRLLAARPGASGGSPRQIADIPEMDKTNYISVYPLEDRCTGGRLPRRGLIFDESAGSSGQATNWVRGAKERSANIFALRLGATHRFGSAPVMYINAFALGPWATGINLAMALSSWGRVKSTGPEITKIANTLKYFGTGHRYVILGYPPFLKQLVDSAAIAWEEYDVSMIFGGEGMTESSRRYLQARGIGNIYGSYGASDLELNIATETDFTIALRRILEQRTDIANKLLRHAGASPMIFQYNPSEFFVESNADDELLVTICRPNYVAPKVRYNIHDKGHVMRFAELRGILASHGIQVGETCSRLLDLPVMFHYGRSDLSVAYYGCKIAPADVQEAIFQVPSMADAVSNFQLQTHEDIDGDKRLTVHVECSGQLPKCRPDDLSRSFFAALAAVNQDFRESRRMVPADKAPAMMLHCAGEGPFANCKDLIKRQYIDARNAATC